MNEKLSLINRLRLFMGKTIIIDNYLTRKIILKFYSETIFEKSKKIDDVSKFINTIYDIKVYQSKEKFYIDIYSTIPGIVIGKNGCLTAELHKIFLENTNGVPVKINVKRCLIWDFKK